MARARFLLLSLLSGLLVSCDESSVKPAAASAVSRPVSEAEFLSALVAASRSGRPDAVRALVHPATFQHGEKHAEAFVAEWLSREANRAIPETRRVTTTAIARDAPLPFEGSLRLFGPADPEPADRIRRVPAPRRVDDQECAGG